MLADIDSSECVFNYGNSCWIVSIKFVCLFVCLSGQGILQLSAAHLHNAYSYSSCISEYLIFENAYALIYIYEYSIFRSLFFCNLNFYYFQIFTYLTYFPYLLTFLRGRIHRSSAQRQNVLNIIYATALLITYASRLKSNTGLGDLLWMILVLMAVSKEGSVIYSS